jgi:hypothetical protein
MRFVLLIAGCTTVTVDVFATCQLDVALATTAALPGDTVEATGGPYTIARDTHIEVGGVAAEVTLVLREGCDACDECLALAECGPCGPCFGENLDVPTRVSCFGDPLADPAIPPVCDVCEEALSFVVPAGVPPGPTTVLVWNANGASPGIPFEVLALPADTGSTGDTSATGDTGTDTSDTGGP